jgi:tRNA (guanine37-N1)-methyltransferase
VHIDILTLFPEMFEGPFGYGIFKRALDTGIVDVNIHNIRDFSHDKHHIVDDSPYGGGAGMLLKSEPIFEAVEKLKCNLSKEEAKELPVILLSPQGRLFSQQVARELAGNDRLLLVCGHYEGIDERVASYLATDEISIGDYILGGGELAAMVICNTVVRLLPGALGSELSSLDDSHVDGLLEYPQYTRPADFRSFKVPDVLLSGDHGRIVEWRHKQSLLRTARRRPDLLSSYKPSSNEKRLLEELEEEGSDS